MSSAPWGRNRSNNTDAVVDESAASADNQSLVHLALPYALPALFVVAYLVYLMQPAPTNASSASARVLVHGIVFFVVMWFLYVYDVGRRFEEADAESKVMPDTFMQDATASVQGVHWHTNKVDVYADSMGTGKPFAFVFLPKHPEMVAVFKGLEFAKRYDESSYMQSMVLLERFLQRYYKLIVLDDDDSTVVGHIHTMLKDIRTDLLNTMHNLIINVPTLFKRPVLKNKQPTGEYIGDCLRKVQAFTYGKLMLASKKANADGVNLYDRRHKPPYSPNEFRDEHDVY